MEFGRLWDRNLVIIFISLPSSQLLTPILRCVEMAKEFPHVEVWGVDCQNLDAYWKKDTPKNCNFRIVHPEEILSEKYSACFDLIHLRFVAGSVRYFFTMRDYAKSCP
jgi:hypothetical protein